MYPAARQLRALAVLAAFGGLAACSDSSGSDEATVQQLAVAGIRVNAANFSSTGEFELGLLATDDEGNAIVNTGLGVTAEVTSVSTGATPSISVQEKRAQRAENKPLAAAIDIDDSGSMSSNDPNRLRAQAAQTFWEAVLDQRASNQVALFDFGAGTTSGFTATRMLQDWTSDRNLLAAQLSNIVASGGTPLYESLLDVVGYVNTSRSASQYQRVILFLSDGQPNSYTNRNAAIQAAKDAGIVVHTVGLGPSSDVDPSRSESAVQAIREIAEQTGGVYASATNAAGLAPVFATLATVSSQGQLITEFRLNPIPASGTRVSGTVTVTGGGGNATANWSFVVP